MVFIFLPTGFLRGHSLLVLRGGLALQVIIRGSTHPFLFDETFFWNPAFYSQVLFLLLLQLPVFMSRLFFTWFTWTQSLVIFARRAFNVPSDLKIFIIGPRQLAELRWDSPSYFTISLRNANSERGKKACD